MSGDTSVCQPGCVRHVRLLSEGHVRQETSQPDDDVSRRCRTRTSQQVREVIVRVSTHSCTCQVPTGCIASSCWCSPRARRYPDHRHPGVDVSCPPVACGEVIGQRFAATFQLVHGYAATKQSLWLECCTRGGTRPSRRYRLQTLRMACVRRKGQSCSQVRRIFGTETVSGLFSNRSNTSMHASHARQSHHSVLV